jgi:short-subunit dehydrogenase
MIKQKEGVIINVASTAAFQPLPYMSNYGASKAFVLSFSEALWAEYQGQGIRILAVCPGPVATEFFDAMGNKLSALGKRDTAETVAKTALRAIDKNKIYVIPGSMRYYWLVQLSRLVPRQFVAKTSEKVMRKNREK